MQQQQQQEQNQEPAVQGQQQGGMFGSVRDMCKMMLIFMLVQNLIGWFFKGGSQVAPDQDGNRQISNKYLQNILKPNDIFDFDVYLSYRDPYAFFNFNTLQKGRLVWSEKNLAYNYSESNLKHQNITIPVSEELRANKTLYLHMQIKTRNPFYYMNKKINVKEDTQQKTGEIVEKSKFIEHQEYMLLNESIPLVRYLPKEKAKKTRNLLSETDVFTEVKEESNNEEDNILLPHFKPELYLYLLYDTQSFQYPSGVLPQLAPYLKINTNTMTYEPIMYLSDYWVLKRDLVLVNESVNDLNLTLHFNTYSLNYFMMQKQFQQQQSFQKQYGLEGGDMDEMKRMFLETDPILLSVTMIVSLLHTVFEVLAFKNDIHFWKSKDSMEGISVKSLYIQFFCTVIIFLYLFDNDTSYLILFSSGFGLLLDVWKIKKASKVTTIDKFPYFKLEDNQKYVESETKEYDRIAMRYMSYALFPLIVGYTIYSVFYNEHKGWYSFVINTLVGTIYTFGFIQMTPQLYINYRLKTVEHMPSKALFYRFLNTIIDDLFSFIITMPTLHRISCFRDDVIFLIYLYQRWIYKVDKTRGPYGSKDEEIKEQAKKAEEVKQIEQTESSTTSEKNTQSNVTKRKNKVKQEDHKGKQEEDKVISGKEKTE